MENKMKRKFMFSEPPAPQVMDMNVVPHFCMYSSPRWPGKRGGYHSSDSNARNTNVFVFIIMCNIVFRSPTIHLPMNISKVVRVRVLLARLCDCVWLAQVRYTGMINDVLFKRGIAFCFVHFELLWFNVLDLLFS